MKQVFFEELDDLNVSLSQNRKEKLYQYWLLLQQHYIMEDEENFEEWCNVLKEYFYGLHFGFWLLHPTFS